MTNAKIMPAAERDAIDAVREEEKLLDQAVVFDAVVGEAAGHVLAEHGIGEETAGHDDERPARGAARGLKHQQDKPRPIEQVKVGDVFHVLQAACDVVRFLKHIHVDGDGQRDQRQIDEDRKPSLLFLRRELA